MLVDQQQAVELAASELRYPSRHYLLTVVGILGSPRRRIHWQSFRADCSHTPGELPSPFQLKSI